MNASSFLFLSKIHLLYSDVASGSKLWDWFFSLLKKCNVLNVGNNKVDKVNSPLVVAFYLFFFISATVSRIKFRHVVGSGGAILKYKRIHKKYLEDFLNLCM